ncbi:perilipin 6 [Scleropages formosus]|uniref:Perilipin 6 n=1 Tax=Scleropages formosus TaxID=113540 RepID=A0A8C9RGK3_SCLFO|nr:perilipin-3-like [Scleropages formosus]XP_018620362.1 perilipin-3-like [Scleropages formosus]
MSDSHQMSEENVLRRVARLPLFSSAAQIVTATYADLKGRYPLVGLVGGVAAISIRRMSLATARSSTPLLQRLEPQISMANSYACVGLDELEKRFPVLQQSAEEVVGRLKDTLFLTMDDLQLRMNEGMGRVVGRTEQVMEQTRAAIQANVMSIQNSSLGGTVVSVLDELLTRSEEAAVYYLPLPDALQREWELSLQRYEEEEDDDDEEPGLWSRARYLGLHVGLLLQHWAGMLRDSLRQRALVLGDLSDTVGLTWLLEAALALSQRLLGFYLAQVYRMEELRSLVVSQLVLLARMFLDLRPVRAALTFPGQVQSTLMVVMRDLWELSQILIQLLINTTPLYNMLQESSEQQTEADLSQEDLSDNCSSRRGSSGGAFPKALDGRGRRRRSLYGRSRRGSASTNTTSSPAGSPINSNSRRSSLKQETPSLSPAEAVPVPSPAVPRRRSSATEILLSPIMQFVTQNQRAFEYISPSPYPEDSGTPLVETTEH